MKEFLEKIRIPDKNLKLSRKIINTSLIFLLGIILGIFSKWLDNLSINNTVWWQHILGVLDLGNVFLLFIGMTVSYHLYTIYVSGFNPKSYMMIWYTITLISPVLAFICWYVKSKNKISLIVYNLLIALLLAFVFRILV